MAAEAARIDPRDRGLLLGDGVFETFAAADGYVYRLAEHLERLAAGAAVLGIPVPANDIERAVRAVLEANGLARGRAALRLTLSHGVGQRGLLAPTEPRPNLLLTAVAAPALPETVTAVTASVRRNEHSPTASIKHLSFLDNVIARNEAARQGADEAIMRNTAGNVAEASAANVFTIEAGCLVTPAISEGALPGVTRQAVIDLAAELDIAAHDTVLTVERITGADEAFLTNSLIGVCPLVTLDGHTIGAATAGPMTLALKSAYEKVSAP
jgi:branched-chain amino acid aminotransferase